ncbi:MAG TPA: ssDNA-binding protein, partial [Methylophilaceae bacterium]|nr:ssDNA-binding protein [Methylophilaceae bacterium]
MSEVVLSNVRLSYVNVWEPRPNLAGVMKYSVSVLMEKKNKAAIATCEKAVKEAIDAAVKAGKLSKAQVSIVQNPLRDGTKEY